MSETLIVELDARTTKLDAKVKKTKSNLGDLDDATQKTDASLLSMSSVAGVAAKSIAVLATATGAATLAAISFAKSTGETQQELETQARLAGISTEEFKELAFAMGTVGLSAEKFGDQSKDAAEKVGEFNAELTKTGTGAGGLVDFMTVMGYTEEQIKDTAEAMEDMSSDQILQFMVNEMEGAGVSAKQMSFALEGVASDTTNLIPLLLNNGKVLKDLTGQFSALNNELSDEERQNYKEFANNMNLVEGSFKDFISNALAPFLPKMNEATKAVAEFFAEWNAQLDIDRISESIQSGDFGSLLGDVDTEKEAEVFQEKLNQIVSDQGEAIRAAQKNLETTIGNESLVVGNRGYTQEQFDESVALREAELEKQKEFQQMNLDAYQQFLDSKAEIDQAVADAEEEQDVESARAEANEIEVEQYRELQELMLEIDQEVADEREALLQKRVDAEEAANTKILKAKEASAKTEAKLEKAKESLAMRTATTLLSSSMSTQEKLFSIVKDAAASQIEAYGLTAGAKALAELGPIAGPPAAASMIGWTQVAAGVVRALPMGGGSGSSSSPEVSTDTTTTTTADFEEETTGLEVTEQSSSGSNTQTVMLSTDSGDDIMTAIVDAINEGIKSGQTVLNS